jgi:hypothetical protein
MAKEYEHGKRDGVDAFVRDQLPGLLAEATKGYGDVYDGWQADEEAGLITAKIDWLRARK